MVFVDTGAWFALYVPDDPDHQAAISWLCDNEEPLVTTDFVVSELLTLLRVRGESRRAIEIGRSLLEETQSKLHFITPVQFRRGWILYQQARAREWSITDCLSKVLIDELGIRKAFAFDGHFRQFGSVEVVPN